MKNQLLKIALVTLASLFVFACKKKSDSTPAPSATSPATQVTINNKTYTATTRVSVPNDSTIIDGTFDPTISSTGSYVAYTSSRTAKNVTSYELFFFQANIPTPGDTIASGLYIESASPIATGTYNLYGQNNLPKTLPIGAVIYNDTNSNYNDSTATGVLVITQLDMANKTISGTYSYTATGIKGSSPATLMVTNGQFTNISIQEF